ncbi:hypothetical protein D9M71_832730 [compost metagenome]
MSSAFCFFSLASATALFTFLSAFWTTFISFDSALVMSSCASASAFTTALVATGVVVVWALAAVASRPAMRVAISLFMVFPFR